MPMVRLPDPEPDFDSDEWHEAEYGSSLRPYDHSEGDTLGPCGCVDYHMADCDDGLHPKITKEDT